MVKNLKKKEADQGSTEAKVTLPVKQNVTWNQLSFKIEEKKATTTNKRGVSQNK